MQKQLFILSLDQARVKSSGNLHANVLPFNAFVGFTSRFLGVDTRISSNKQMDDSSRYTSYKFNVDLPYNSPTIKIVSYVGKFRLSKKN